MSYSISSVRWHLKKAARCAAITLSKLLSDVDTNPTLRVLTYHRFNGGKLDPVAINSDDFEAQLQWLVNNVDVLDANEFISVLNGSRRLSRNAVLLTVDDGHKSFFEVGYPLLMRYGVPAIVFVCPGLVNNVENVGEFMSWTELLTVLNGGILVSSHGFSHISLGKMSLSDAEDEIVAAKFEIIRNLNVNTPFFSFPFGTRSDYSGALADILHQHGYYYCFTSTHGACMPRSNLNLIPRIKIESGETLRMFIDSVMGHMDIWRHIDNSAWYFQQRGRF